MNYQQEEINKFDHMAPRWWDENGPLKTLHQINPLRVNFILENLNKINIDNLNILDVGCGGGILAESLAKLGAKVTGIDLSQQAIEVAKLHASEQNIQDNHLKYLTITIEELAKKSEQKFDIITCMELLEHVPSPESIIYHMKLLLNSNGYMFLSTINRNIKAYLLAVVGAEYILNWLPRGTHDYQKFIKPSELAKVLRDNNLDIQKISGVTYSLLKQEFILAHDIDVNYMVCAR